MRTLSLGLDEIRFLEELRSRPERFEKSLDHYYFNPGSPQHNLPVKEDILLPPKGFHILGLLLFWGFWLGFFVCVFFAIYIRPTVGGVLFSRQHFSFVIAKYYVLAAGVLENHCCL